MIDSARSGRWAKHPTLISVVAPAVSPARAASVDTARLNVLFMVADDLGASLGCYGDDEVKSPQRGIAATK